MDNKHDTQKWTKLFKTGQYGRFYVVNSPINEFYIQVLPEGETVTTSGEYNLSRSSNAVTVFGPRWKNPKKGTPPGRNGKDRHEWFYQGPWVSDFNKLADELQADFDVEKSSSMNAKEEKAKKEQQRIAALLAAY